MVGGGSKFFLWPFRFLQHAAAKGVGVRGGGALVGVAGVGENSRKRMSGGGPIRLVVGEGKIPSRVNAAGREGR